MEMVGVHIGPFGNLLNAGGKEYKMQDVHVKRWRIEKIKIGGKRISKTEVVALDRFQHIYKQECDSEAL